MGIPVGTIAQMTGARCGAWPIPCAVGVPNVHSTQLPMTTMGSFWGIHATGKWWHPEFATSVMPNVQCCSLPISGVGTPTSNGDMEATGVPIVAMGA